VQYNSKMKVVRVSTKADGVGGLAATGDITVHESLPCRINWSRGKEKLMFNKQDYLRDAKVYCRVVDILESDVVIIKDVRYNIVGLTNTDEVNRQMVLEIIKIAV